MQPMWTLTNNKVLAGMSPVEVLLPVVLLLVVLLISPFQGAVTEPAR